MTRYLYLVDEVKNRPLAVFPFDHLRGELEVIAFEKRLRCGQGVDDPESGVVVRDSRLRPLPAKTLARLPVHSI